MYEPEYQNIINDICRNNEIACTVFDNRCISLNHNGITRYIWSRRFPHNSASSSRLIDSKCLCSLVLHSAGLPVVLHSKLYRSDLEGYGFQNRTNQQICENILTISGGVVIKPNDSYEGNDVFACFSSKEIECTLYNVFKRREILAVSPYIKASAEYRVFFLDGECLLAYRKKLPYVVGNGMSTLASLVSHANVLSSDLQKELDFSSIPEDGKKIEIGWKYNLSRGSTPEVINEKAVLSKLYPLAIKAAEIVDARFVTVDLLEDTQTKELLILEINAGVAMDQFILKHPQGRSIAYSIYEKAILSLF